MTLAGIELVRHLRLGLEAKIVSDATPQGDVLIRLLQAAENVAELASHLADEDPDWVRSELEDGHQVPAYSYARNNPVTTIDPTGLYSWRVECQGRGVAFEYTNVFSAPPLILKNLSSSGLTTASNDPCEDYSLAIELGNKYKNEPWFKAQIDCWKALKKEIGGQCHGIPRPRRAPEPPAGYAGQPNTSGGSRTTGGVCGP